MTDERFDRPLTRRSLIKGGGGLALGAPLGGALSAWGGGDKSGGEAATGKGVKAKIDGDLVYFNWTEYLDPALIKSFQKHYGVKVTQSNYDSMEGMMAKLNSGNVYDLIFPSAEYVDRLRKANRLLKIDHTQLKNASQVFDFSPYFQNPWYDPQSAHSVPYAMYTTGIGWRADKVPEMTGSFADLWNEQAKGKIFVLDDYQEGVGMANLRNGFDLNTTNPDELKKSQQLLIGQKP